MTTTLVDFSDARPEPSAIKAAKVSGVIRYISEYSPKCLTIGEAAKYRLAGLSIGLVYEDGAEDFCGGANAGTAKAHIAAPILAALGVPKDRPVYCAIDGGLALSQYVMTYEGIHAFCSSLGRPDAIYGPRPFMLWCEQKHGVEWHFEPGAADANTGLEPKNKRLQQLVVRPAGVGVLSGVDYDSALMADWGQWPAPVAPKPIIQRLVAGMFWCENSPKENDGDWLVYKTEKCGIQTSAELANIQAHAIPRKILAAAQIKALKTVEWGKL